MYMEKLITIDGLASSGKSTLAKNLSQKLDWSWFSTGVLYRGMAYVGWKENFTERDFFQFFKSKDWQLELKPLKTHFFYKGEDVTAYLYSEEIDEWASSFSSEPEYRKALIEHQRSFYTKNEAKGLILEGRDCGTILFPEAPLKIFLEAPENQRAERRAKERKKDSSLIVRVLKERDERDKKRYFAPSVIPDGAFVLNSSSHKPEELVLLVYERVQEVFS